MAFKVNWTDEAVNDLDEIIEFLGEKWTDEQVRNFFARLEECLSNIKEAPHQPKDSLRKEGTKEYQHSKKTTIFYSYDDKVINILRLWTNLKNPERL
ncbi:MAG: type II toxin-antitoxin system RelE/ParE family toxin [Ekhidna sp.]|uniref:type II toxin-antitoxin system RelE/ParE family toxin n=1 Tax=Ekhidna sp. TaxID=2608089 RepID=UPI0032F05449